MNWRAGTNGDDSEMDDGVVSLTGKKRGAGGEREGQAT